MFLGSESRFLDNNKFIHTLIPSYLKNLPHWQENRVGRYLQTSGIGNVLQDN